MSIAKPLKKLVSAVVLDLDGTLLNTDGIVSDVLKIFLLKYGKKWDGRETHKIVGKTPLEAATTVVEDYELPCSIDEFTTQITPLLYDQWCNIKALPGANRLIKHLSGHKVPMALASNSPRVNIESKISYHQGWKESFSVIVGGDEVTTGKPSPEIFLEAGKRLNIEPSSCLVIEDSFPGVTAGKAAGMEVVAVPSIPKQSHLYTAADEVINSLLDLQLEKWGLPPFEDWIEGTLPIEPWHIGGPVVKGFGRGSKVLGTPTANLSTEGYSEILSQHPSGVYFGWAGLSTKAVYKMVMSIGWNPYFNNTEKTIEPWLLHEFLEDFYDEELRLVIVGYIRPEANFSSLESLIAKIHEDRRIAERALDIPLYSKYKNDLYLKEMQGLTSCICWKLVKKEGYIAIWQKPLDNSCYLNRGSVAQPPLCDSNDDPDNVWYGSLRPCMTRLPENGYGANLTTWPIRLHHPPDRLQSIKMDASISRKELFKAESKYWYEIIESYVGAFHWKQMNFRNVMDMRAGFGGFAAAMRDVQIDCWVMNVVPVNEFNALPVIYDRGLIGVMHDWCEPFDTYPRTYDLLHAAGLFSAEQKRNKCNISSIMLEMDRMLRPGGTAYIRDSVSVMGELQEIVTAMQSMRWVCAIRDTVEGPHASWKILTCEKRMP